MNHRLFAAVEARIDRGVTQAKARAAAQQMADRATRAVEDILGPHDCPDARIDALDALLDAAAARRAALADREGLMGKLGALCATHAPVINLGAIKRARAELKFKKTRKGADA